MSVLDDLKMIHERDKDDALGVAGKQWQQLKHTYEIGNWEPEIENCQNIVLAGMGGSALAAEIAASWPGVNRPFEIVKDYELPAYVDEKTLFIASSYSGNTEETVAALTEAERRGAKIVILCAGGNLADRAKEKDYPHYMIPEGLQPRMAVFYNFAALIQLFEAAGAVTAGSVDELQKTADWLKDQAEMLLPTVPSTNNPAKKIALELVGNSIVIYSGHKMFPAAYKWKINFNENAKNIAWCNKLPEYNHNEILGWTSQPAEKPYKVIDLISSLEHPRTVARFSITEKLLSGRRPAPYKVQAQGETLLQHLLYTIQLGDFVSLYLALINGLNPTPVELIEKLKVELKNT